MPLTEFLRLSKGKMDATQQKATNSNDPPCRQLDSECVELVWENGQIMMQGQSSRPPTKTPLSNNTQTCVHKTEDLRNVNGLKMAKDSVVTDFPLPVSSNDVGLDQDIDTISWLNYPMEDPMHNDYTSDFLRELSGVMINDVSEENHLVSRERKSSFQGDGHRQGNLDKGPSVCEKHTSGARSEVVQFSQPFQLVAPRSDLCNASGNATSACNNVTSLDSVCNASSLCTFTSMRLKRLNTAHPSTSSGVTNFSCFARPNPNGRANPVGGNSLNIIEIDGKRVMLSGCNNTDSTIVSFTTGSQNEKSTQNQSVVATVNESSGSLPTKLAEEFLSLDQNASHEDNARNDTSPNQTCGKTATNVGIVSESNMENVVTPSSVWSGNSAEKTSSQPARDLKRKSQEAGESDGPSEEHGESEGAKKAAPARSGSKRSRAAEVHNLSERRRRDRINEKMRALQELIPNCNKVDKASMLDEAIDYLKSLQLQVQMLTMGMYIHPMMLPPRMQSNTQGAQMPQFSHMGAGMGVGGMGMSMGCGMNMLGMNSNMKMVPFPGTHYPAHAGNAFQGMPGSNIHAFGHHSQGSPMPIQRAHVHPVSGAPGALNIPLGPNVSSMAGPHVAHLAPSTNSRDVGIQVMPGHYVNAPMAQCQATNMAIERPAPPHDQPQVLNASEVAIPTSASDSIPSCD